MIDSTVLMSRSLGSTPTPASRSFAATTSRSAGERRIGTHCLRFLPRHAPSRDQGAQPRPIYAGRRYRRSPSHVPCKSRRPSSRRLRAGHHLANSRAAARLIPGAGQRPPVLMPSSFYSASTTTPGQALDALERLLGPHLTRSRRAFSLTLTTRGCPEFRGTSVAARGCSGHFFIVLVGCDGHSGDFGVEGSAQSR